MSLLFASQSSVRIFGPFMFTAIYDATGMYLITAIMASLMLCSGILVVATYKRLAPFADRYADNDSLSEGSGQIESLQSEDLTSEFDFT